MKKRAFVLFALSLILFVSSASAQTYTAGTYYSLDYPDALTLDNTSYTDQSTDDNQWLFMLAGSDYLIDAAATTVEDYKGFTLSTATATERSAYVAEVMETFADQKPKLADIAETNAGIPFYIFAMSDSDGPYYYAETIVGGTSLNFCCYYYDATLTPDTALLANLESVLATLRLMGGGRGDSDQV